MKKIFLFFLFSGLVLAVRSQAVVPTENLQFRELTHDFSQIPKGKPAFYSFEILNTSKQAIKIDNVQASCGCTTPEWSREPIPAGGMTRIKVGYNAAAAGYFEKTINVTYNGTETKVLTIKGTVWSAPEGSAPVNAAVDFLKKQTF